MRSSALPNMHSFRRIWAAATIKAGHDSQRLKCSAGLRFYASWLWVGVRAKPGTRTASGSEAHDDTFGGGRSARPFGVDVNPSLYVYAGLHRFYSRSSVSRTVPLNPSRPRNGSTLRLRGYPSKMDRTIGERSKTNGEKRAFGYPQFSVRRCLLGSCRNLCYWIDQFLASRAPPIRSQAASSCRAYASAAARTHSGRMCTKKSSICKTVMVRLVHHSSARA